MNIRSTAPSVKYKRPKVADRLPKKTELPPLETGKTIVTQQREAKRQAKLLREAKRQAIHSASDASYALKMSKQERKWGFFLLCLEAEKEIETNGTISERSRQAFQLARTDPDIHQSVKAELAKNNVHVYSVIKEFVLQERMAPLDPRRKKTLQEVATAQTSLTNGVENSPALRKLLTNSAALRESLMLHARVAMRQPEWKFFFLCWDVHQRLEANQGKVSASTRNMLAEVIALGREVDYVNLKKTEKDLLDTLEQLSELDQLKKLNELNPLEKNRLIELEAALASKEPSKAPKDRMTIEKGVSSFVDKFAVLVGPDWAGYLTAISGAN
jgi:hypothetical protein